MRLSPKGAAFIRLHEGFRSRWYRDPTGTGTIGIGFTWGSASFRDWWTLNKPGARFGPGATMTTDEAEEALIFLVEREYGKAVNAFLKKEVPQHVFDAMCSAAFNLGAGSLKWKWAAAAKAGDYRTAAARLRVTGTTSKGRKLPGLVRRRKEEALLLEKGVYTGVRATPAAKPAEKPPAKPVEPTRGDEGRRPDRDTEKQQIELLAFGSNGWAAPQRELDALEKGVANSRARGRIPVFVPGKASSRMHRGKVATVARLMERKARELGVSVYRMDGWSSADDLHPSIPAFKRAAEKHPGAIVRGDSFAEGIIVYGGLSQDPPNIMLRGKSGSVVLAEIERIDGGLLTVPPFETEPADQPEKPAKASPLAAFIHLILKLIGVNS